MAGALSETPARFGVRSSAPITGSSSRTTQEPELTARQAGLTHRSIRERLIQELAAPAAAPLFARQPLAGAKARPKRATAWLPDS
jgi:hypothetical protein